MTAFFQIILRALSVFCAERNSLKKKTSSSDIVYGEPPPCLDGMSAKKMSRQCTFHLMGVITRRNVKHSEGPAGGAAHVLSATLSESTGLTLTHEVDEIKVALQLRSPNPLVPAPPGGTVHLHQAVDLFL
jgi:hypothetical protein